MTDANSILRRAALFLLAVLLSAPAPCRGEVSARTAVATTPHFAFYSDFATNLNDALNAAGVARNHHQPELFHSGAEESCFDKLPASTRAGWDLAVDYYAKIISPKQFTAREQYLLRLQLAGIEHPSEDAEARQYLDIAGSFRAAAAPAYEACRWGTQDQENHRWVEELLPRLAAHEERIADRLAELYQKPWGGLPIRVDVVETVDWSGANSILRHPAGGHLLISRSYQGPAALEIVFHEASHLLMDRGDPLRQALKDAADTLGVPLPGDLWHVLLFYTTGEAVRGILDQAGETGYTPMIYDIFNRSEKWNRYRHAIETAWPAYLKGKRTAAEAARDLLQALPPPEKP